MSFLFASMNCFLVLILPRQDKSAAWGRRKVLLAAHGALRDDQRTGNQPTYQ
jgi:hypothetical protein